MTAQGWPAAWEAAYRRDALEKPSLPDPVPERRLARLLAAFVISGLFFMIAPGTLLGVWNLVKISSDRQMASVPTAWIQAHGHAQLFGWVGTFILGISLYTLPKFRGSTCRSISAGWAMWALWSFGVALRWIAGVEPGMPQAAFALSAGLELAAVAILLWEFSAAGPKHKHGQPWELPVFAGLGGLVFTLGWQMLLVIRHLNGRGLPAAPDRTLISLALWAFCLPVVLGYSLKFFPGLIGTPAADRRGIRVSVVLLAAAAAGYALDRSLVASAFAAAAVALACWSLRVFHRPSGKPKRNGVDPRYPQFARLAYVWLAVAAALGMVMERPGMMGASRHAFTVGFLATLIFAIGPRILPSFLNSRELWSAQVMRWTLILLTAGCALRVSAEPLAYGGLVQAAWGVLPISALSECAAVLLFGLNLAMSLATPIPAWFRSELVNDNLTVYWLVASYPATRKLLVENGLVTLSRVKSVPKSLTLREAAEADGIPPEALTGELSAFFQGRLARSLRNA